MFNYYQQQSGNSSYQQEGTDIPPYSFFDAYAGQQGTGIPPEYYYNAIEMPSGGSPYQDMTDWARQQREKEKGAVPPPGGYKDFLKQYLQKKGTGTEQAGANFNHNLNLPYVPGKDFTGVPNADNPVMKEKLRNRLLKNPTGGQELPSFLVRGV